MHRFAYVWAALLVYFCVGVQGYAAPLTPVELRQQVEQLAKENARIIQGTALSLTHEQRLQLYKAVYPNQANSWVGAIRQVIVCSSIPTHIDPSVCNASQLTKILQHETSFKPYTLMEVTRYMVTQDQLMAHYEKGKQQLIRATQDSKVSQQTPAVNVAPQIAASQGADQTQNHSGVWLVVLALVIVAGITALTYATYRKRKSAAKRLALTASECKDLVLTPQQLAFVEWYHTLKRCQNYLQGLSPLQLMHSVQAGEAMPHWQSACYELLQFSHALEDGLHTANTQRSHYNITTSDLETAQTKGPVADETQLTTDSRLALLHIECMTLKGLLEKNDLKNTALYHWVNIAICAIYAVCMYRANSNSKPRFITDGATVHPYSPAPVTVANVKPTNYLKVVHQSLMQQVQNRQAGSLSVCA